MLRRLKTDPDVNISLPQKHVHKVTCRFTAAEQQAYDTFSNDVKGRMGMMMKDGCTTYQNALTLLLRMRQGLCDNRHL